MISRRLQKTILAGFAALSLLLSIAPTFAQPAPVPALPDTERRTSYSITASTCACSVGFALYGDSTDYANWVEVYVNGALISATGNWTITSPSGSLSSLPRPITDAVLTFTAQQTGTVQIVGAMRPRRTSQFSENAGVSARNLNQALTYSIASLREVWDKTNDVSGRALLSQPGVTLGLLPLPSVCINGFLGFDSTGLIPVCRSSSGAGNVTLPVVSGDLAMFTGTAGMLADSGAIPTTPSTKDYLAGTDFTAGTTTSLTLTSTPPSKNVVTVAFDGIWQSANTWSLSGAVVTFSAAIPTNTQVVEIKWSSSLNGVYGAVSSIQAGGQTLSGPVQMSAGNGIGLTVSGQNIAIAAVPPAGEVSRDYNIVVDGGAKCNYHVVADGAMGAASTTLTSATASFKSADVGKYVAVKGAAASGANLFTTISAYTSPTTVTLTSASTGAVSGAIVEYGNDDAAAINASISAALTAGQNVYVPPGQCFASQVNLTHAGNIIFHGAGFGLSQIFPLQVASYGTPTGHWFDMAGASYAQVRDLQLGAYYELAEPTTAFFQAQVPSGACNVQTLGPNLYVSGRFSYSAIYNYGCPSSAYDHSQIYNYASALHSVVSLNATNSASLSSPFTTIITGTSSTSDITFYKDEIHNFSGSSSYVVVDLVDASNISWFGGNITGGAQYYVLFTNTAHISFNNVTFETEGMPEPAYALAFGSGAGTNTDITTTGSMFIVTGNVWASTPTSANLVTNGN